MNEGWIIFGLIVVFILGAALPLLRQDHSSNTPLPPAKETLRDWRSEADKD